MVRNERIFCFCFNGYNDVDRVERARVNWPQPTERTIVVWRPRLLCTHAAPLKQHQYKLINEKTSETTTVMTTTKEEREMSHAYNVYVFK